MILYFYIISITIIIFITTDIYIYQINFIPDYVKFDLVYIL